jgi:SWI/SNF-related matrix-associated actin-dependent regulator 1 of chromatin subfamily A
MIEGRGNDFTFIVPDSQLAEESHARAQISEIAALGNAWLFVDEAQRFNHSDSLRTKALFKIARQFSHVVFLSGTPMRKRPMELYPILSQFAGETLDYMSENQYGFSYCAGKFDSFGRPDYRGASNTEYLFNRIKEKFMLRLRKADVLPELPPVTTEIVFLGEKGCPTEIRDYERKHLASLSPRDCTRSKITKSPALATYRRLLGRHKVKPAASFIDELLKSGDDVILVFAQHKEVVASLVDQLAKWSPVCVTGLDNAETKQKKTQAFQKEKGFRLFIGNTQACGLGFTLTRATRVIHVEPSWVPTENDQARDRAHRIGQTEPVFEQYLCFINSLDRAIIESGMKAREVLNQL